MMLLTDMP